MTDNASEGALAGLFVVDLTWSWAGPLATRVLADLGAEVVKVEGVTRPDWTRFLYYADNTPGPIPWEAGGFFHDLNRNKKGIAIDLATARGRDLLLELIARADVFVESFTPRVKAAWGIEYGELRRRNPGLVMASLSGFGQQGPFRDYLAFGPTMEAMSGITALGGEPNGPCERVGVMYGDPIMGLAAAAAILDALYEREQSGEGQYVDVAGTESCMALIGEAFVYASVHGEDPPRDGGREDDALFSGCFPCAGEDEWIAVSCHSPRELALLADTLGLPPGFAAPTHTAGRQATVCERTSAWSGVELERVLQTRGIAALRVASSADLVADNHLATRAFHLRLPHPVVGERTITGTAFASSGLERPRTALRPAPAYGGDAVSVLGERLGLTEREIGEVVEAGVVALAPRVQAWPQPAPIPLWRQMGLVRDERRSPRAEHKEERRGATR
jgi:crotonobetainyl-CoA:carnitine CoA-transferase CaiB-like acyl-CoA transferase